MSADHTPTHRATRRNLSTQPIPRGEMGPKTAGQRIRYTPLTDAELAYVIDQARAQRTEEDIASYVARKVAR